MLYTYKKIYICNNKEGTLFRITYLETCSFISCLSTLNGKLHGSQAMQTSQRCKGTIKMFKRYSWSSRRSFRRLCPLDLLFEFSFLTERAFLEYILTKGLRTMRERILKVVYIFMHKRAVHGIIFEVPHVKSRRNGLFCKHTMYTTHLQINIRINKLCRNN